jgi:hypothetical protein
MMKMAAWMKGTVSKRSFNLTVAEVGSKDVGRRLARIDPKVAQDCQMQTGDALKISSEKTDTVAISTISFFVVQ